MKALGLFLLFALGIAATGWALYCVIRDEYRRLRLERALRQIRQIHDAFGVFHDRDNAR